MRICLYFQVHQPYRLQEYNFFQIGREHFYENEPLNKHILQKIAQNCYLKMNEHLLGLIKKYPDKFHLAFSLSGTAIEQFENYCPEVLESFQKLSQTGNVEFLSETYHHSLAFLYSRDEFEYQVNLHKNKIEKLFNYTPLTFRNTELIYDNDLAQKAEEMGYKVIITEAVDRILKKRHSFHLYSAPFTSKIKILLRDYELSDDISFRFSDPNWKEYPITPKSYTQKIKRKEEKGAECINIFMDYETFGEHQNQSTGIFDFFNQFVENAIEKEGWTFASPSQVSNELSAKDEYAVSDYISWADTERDLSAWLSNSMQYEALHKIYHLRNQVMSVDSHELTSVWRKLQSSDHFYYMCTKYWSDGDVHKYFSPYNSPYDAYIYYMNILSDFELLLKKAYKTKNI